MEKPRGVYLEACAQLGARLEKRGFKYAKSGPRVQRTSGDFVFRLIFASSHYNTAGHSVALRIYADVSSKRLERWRATQPRPSRPDGWIAGGAIGNLRLPHQWIEWNLADPVTREQTIDDVWKAVEEIALPYFALFEDFPALAPRIVTAGLPSLSPASAIEFLLCFADRDSAEAYFQRCIADRPDLVPAYRAELRKLRSGPLPPFQFIGYALELAFVTCAYHIET